MALKGMAEAKKRIMLANDIVVAGHVNPDGDSIGSLLSLGLGLRELGKTVHMLSSDGVPRRYRMLPGANRINNFHGHPADLAISVDCGNREILGGAYDAFRMARSIIEIDHHHFRRPFGDIQLIDNDAAAVGEVVYSLLNELNVRITKEIAQNLLTSIVVETNSFRLPCVRPFTFEVCTELIKNGIDFYKLVDMVFWSKRRESAILSGICMSRCKFLNDGAIAWSVIRGRDFASINGLDEDVDAVPDEMRSIGSVKIAALFREKNRKTLRVSIRSKDKINVAAVAEHYNGGGHFDVAGCQIPNSQDSIGEFLRRIQRILP